MLNIAVLVSGGGTNLQALIDAGIDGRLTRGSITLVLSSKSDVKALTRASSHGIKTRVVERTQYPNPKDFDREIQRQLESHSIDLVVLAGFLSVLGPELVQNYDGRMINVHPSLLPSFCGPGLYGLRVHEAALARGVKITGATVHYVDSIPDHGEILLQRAVDVLPGDTAKTLQQRVMEEAEWILLPKATESICQTLKRKEYSKR